MTEDVFGLTPLMRDCMRVIQELSDRDGAMPTYDRISRELGFANLSRAFTLCGNLAERGYLRRLRGRPRSLAIVRRVDFPTDFEFEITDAGKAAVAL